MIKKLTLLAFASMASFTAMAQAPDTISQRLPFQISEEKRLSEEDIANKKEGVYVTGLPELTSDPIRGLTVGANAFLFNNKDRNDPFFITPPTDFFNITVTRALNFSPNKTFKLLLSPIILLEVPQH